MNDNEIEQIIGLATVFSTTLSKNCSREELVQYRVFFQTVTNNLNSILSSKK